ncbi:MAG: hypothetical protein P8124_11285 [Gammaproteobacteria bacterium]
MLQHADATHFGNLAPDLTVNVHGTLPPRSIGVPAIDMAAAVAVFTVALYRAVLVGTGTVYAHGQSQCYKPISCLIRTSNVYPLSKRRLTAGKRASAIGIVAAMSVFVATALAIWHWYLHQPASRPFLPSQAALRMGHRSPTSLRDYPRIGQRYVLAADFIICRQQQGVVDFDAALSRRNRTREKNAMARYDCAATQRADAGLPVRFLAQSGIMRPLAKVRLSNGNTAWVDLAALKGRH